MRRFAQAPPAGAPPMPDPMAGGMPPMPPDAGGGMPPMPDPMGGGGMPPLSPPPMPGGPMGGAPGVAPMATSGPDREEIGSPLDTLGKILYDFNITDRIMDNPEADAADLAIEVWKAYGGKDDGKVDDSKSGSRTPKKNVSPEAEKKEQEATDGKRWLRLPKGKTIADITTLEKLHNMMDGLAFSTVKSQAKPAAPPGGAPPMLAHSRAWVRLAALLDREGNARLADALTQRHQV